MEVCRTVTYLQNKNRGTEASMRGWGALLDSLHYIPAFAQQSETPPVPMLRFFVFLGGLMPPKIHVVVEWGTRGSEGGRGVSIK